MRAAVYARVSTIRQAQAQTIEQQLDRWRAAVAERDWAVDEQHVYRDDGYSGASLDRPGLDRLRDHAALADLDVVLVTAPDRLARNYVHQVLPVTCEAEASAALPARSLMATADASSRPGQDHPDTPHTEHTFPKAAKVEGPKSAKHQIDSNRPST